MTTIIYLNVTSFSNLLQHQWGHCTLQYKYSPATSAVVRVEFVRFFSVSVVIRAFVIFKQYKLCSPFLDIIKEVIINSVTSL